MRWTILLLLLLAASIPAICQEDDNSGPQDLQFTDGTPVSLEFKEEEEEEAPKKKKAKKKVFYGVKTKKGFTRKGMGERTIYETFYFLKKQELPQTFVRDIYYYNYDRREIMRTQKFDPKKGVLLHGPYEKRQGEVTLEKGIFYKGTKHGRWMSYGRDSVLTNKEKFFRGWPRESVVSYYDPMEKKRMKEITPVKYGEKEGHYYYFHENGMLGVQGEYKWDEPVGDWVEYYPTGKRKKIITYSREPFDKENMPYVKVEWNEKGKEIYRNNKMARN